MSSPAPAASESQLLAEVGSTYAEYKKDTSFLASWLASTAKTHGYPNRLSCDQDVESAPITSGRLKGKARKEAKKAGLDAKGGLKKHIIEIKEFVPLAEFIKNKKPPIRLLPSVLSTLQRVIVARTAFSTEIESSSQQPDEGHAYFISVLDQVLQLLKPDTKEFVSATAPKVAENKQSLSNRFDKLKAEYTQEPVAATVDRPPSPSGVTYEMEEPKSRCEALFIFMLLISDLRGIRYRVRWAYVEYGQGRLDLAAVAVMADIAISLARTFIEDAVPRIEYHLDSAPGALFEVASVFSFANCMARSKIPPGTHPDVAKMTPEAFNEFYKDDIQNMIEERDEAFVHSFELLKRFNGDNSPISTLQNVGRPIPDNLTTNPIHGRNIVLMKRMVDEYIVCNQVVDYWPDQDDLLREFRKFWETGNISFTLVFSLQIFLDVHHSLGERAASGFYILRDEANAIENDITEYLSFHESIGSSADEFKDPEGLHRTQTILRLLKLDPVGQSKTKLYNVLKRDMPESATENEMLKLSPVMAGLLLRRLRWNYMCFSINIANNIFSITAGADMYNALHKKGLLRCDWVDMETAIDILHPSKLFMGDRPDSVQACHSNYSLTIGISATHYARRAGNEGPPPTVAWPKRPPKYFRHVTPVSEWIVEKVLDAHYYTSDSPRWSAEAIEKIANLSVHDQSGRRKAPGKKQPTRARREGSMKAPNPSDVLESLCVALDREVVSMTFPYLRLHCRCWALLCQLRDICLPYQDELVHLPLSRHVDNGNILWAIVSATLAIEITYPKKGILLRAAEALNGMMESTNPAAITEMLRSKGLVKANASHDESG